MAAASVPPVSLAKATTMGGNFEQVGHNPSTSGLDQLIAFAQIRQNAIGEIAVHCRGRRMIQPAQHYRQIADNYDRLALEISDQALRSLYLDFANQWREIAARAEVVDLIRPEVSSALSSAPSWTEEETDTPV